MFELIDNSGNAHGIIRRDKSLDRGSVGDLALLSGASFDVGYEPLGFNDAGDFNVPEYQHGTYVGEPLAQAIVRADTGDVLGIHSGRYPKREGYSHVFNTLEELFPNTCESVTVLGAGERVVVEQVLDEPIDLGGGDSIQPYLYTRMSLNGKWKTECIPYHIRAFCENMLGYGGGLFGVRATRNHDNLLTMRASLIDHSIAQGEALRTMADVMRSQEFTDAQFTRMVQHLFPVLEPDAHQKTVTARANKVAAVTRKWVDERDTFDQTMWAAYNAVQGAEQHLINANYKTTDAARQRSYIKAVEGKTPIADQATAYLQEILTTSLA